VSVYEIDRLGGVLRAVETSELDAVDEVVNSLVAKHPQVGL
jgi:hypothetical protein